MREREGGLEGGREYRKVKDGNWREKLTTCI